MPQTPLHLSDNRSAIPLVLFWSRRRPQRHYQLLAAGPHGALPERTPPSSTPSIPPHYDAMDPLRTGRSHPVPLMPVLGDGGIRPTNRGRNGVYAGRRRPRPTHIRPDGGGINRHKHPPDEGLARDRQLAHGTHSGNERGRPAARLHKGRTRVTNTLSTGRQGIQLLHDVGSRLLPRHGATATRHHHGGRHHGDVGELHLGHGTCTSRLNPDPMPMGTRTVHYRTGAWKRSQGHQGARLQPLHRGNDGTTTIQGHTRQGDGEQRAVHPAGEQRGEMDHHPQDTETVPMVQRRS